MQGDWGLCIHRNFVSCITAYHVLNGLVTARVIWQPVINFEDETVHDDDVPSICNQSLNLSS